MSLSPGTRLGPYEITAPIGKGGMGEVYRARDTKLERDVAIKILPDELAVDEERVARFEREAKLLASLNHPNIAGIYGFESRALVLELVEGPTLAERIREGAIPVDEAIAIAKQIAEALEAGHEAGVIHRDLKPANIKLKEDGTVKVLDYGLAKALEDDAATTADSELSQSPTLTRQGTQVGVILGTAAYMSPEQARGKRVDKRADIWAFGAVLYEMLTGRRVFDAEDVSLTLAAVMKSEPDWELLPTSLTPAHRALLARCLEKDPRRRVRDIGDARWLLDGTFAAPAEPPTDRAAFGWRGLALGLIVGALLAGVVAWSVRPTEGPPRGDVIRLEATVPDGMAFDLRHPHRSVAISPDGTRAVFPVRDGTERQFVVRELHTLTPVPLSGLSPRASGPFFSPDGQSIGFFDGNTIVKVSVDGDTVVRICDIASGGPKGGSWAPDDSIVFSAAFPAGLVRVHPDDCELDVLTSPDPSEGFHAFPEVLPGGRAVLFTVVGATLETSRIAVLSLESREWNVLLTEGSHPRYAPTGHIVYAVSGELRAAPFDLGRLEITGAAVPVVRDVITKGMGAAEFDISANGSLIYAAGRDIVNARRTLVWKDREGAVERLPMDARAYTELRLSPSGHAVALAIGDGEHDIWIWELEKQTLRRLTFDPAREDNPVWMPDGKTLLFSSIRDGRRQVFRRAVDGTGTATRVADTSFGLAPLSVSPDGSRLIGWAQSLDRPHDLMMLTLDGEPVVTSLVTEGRTLLARLSPDGRFLAFQSNESSRNEIYVVPFPDADAGRWQLSTDGGEKPVWSPTGREIFFVAEGRLLSVPVTTEPAFTHGAPRVVFESIDTFGLLQPSFDVSNDGRRILVIEDMPPEEGVRPRVVVVRNWTEELKQLVPTDD